MDQAQTGARTAWLGAKGIRWLGTSTSCVDQAQTQAMCEDSFGWREGAMGQDQNQGQIQGQGQG